MSKPKILFFDEGLGISEDITVGDASGKKQAVSRVKWEMKRGEYAVMDFSLVSRQLRWLMGEVLTVVDASITNERQLKATKDLVKDKFAGKISWLYEICGMPINGEPGLLESGEEN